MYTGQIIIGVWNCHAYVGRYGNTEDGLTIFPATNWEALEDEATEFVEFQGGAINISGIYVCTAQLAEKARFEIAV